MSEIFELEKLAKFVETLIANDELSLTQERSLPPHYEFPDFGANRLQPTALKHLCLELSGYLKQTVSPTLELPSFVIILKKRLVWKRILEACCSESYTHTNILRVMAALQKEEQMSMESDASQDKTKELSKASSEKKGGNEMLIEMGVKTGLTVVFSLLRQAWAQMAWQKQLELTLQQSGAVVPMPGTAPIISLPNEVLKSVLDIMKGIAPLSLLNRRTLSSLSNTCLTQSCEFLDWIINPDSIVDAEGKRLAMEIMLSITLQYGDLVSLMEWVSRMLSVLTVYHEKEKEKEGEKGSGVATLSLSKEYCDCAIEEIRKRTVSK